MLEESVMLWRLLSVDLILTQGRLEWSMNITTEDAAQMIKVYDWCQISGTKALYFRKEPEAWSRDQ